MRLASGLSFLAFFSSALLMLPAIVAAQPTPLAVQRVWTQDPSGNAKTTFAPGDPIQFAAQLNNSYGGALLSADQIIATSPSFFNNDRTIDIPAGISTWTWNTTVPNTPGSFTVTVKTYDRFYGAYPSGSASFTISSSQTSSSPPPPTQSTPAPPALLAVQRVWTQDTNGNAKTAFAPGEPIQFVIQLNNSYGGALPASEMTLITNFYNNDKSVTIPTGISTQTWSANAPSTQDIYMVTVKVFDTFYKTWITGNTNFIVGTPQHPSLPPVSGWYSNSGAGAGQSIIYQDNSGLVMIWGNSYIYPHPGQSNLYWYAEIIYLNTGNQPLSISCSGRTDPSFAKEWLRGTEGIPSNASGYVAADDTFCRRNPSFTGSLGPGEAHLEWAIFHNVPPDGEIFLEWDPSGESPWVDPWYADFPTNVPLPDVCPSELVTLGTCLPAQQSNQGAGPEFYCLGGTPGNQGKECNQSVTVMRPTSPGPSSEQIQNGSFCAAEGIAKLGGPVTEVTVMGGIFFLEAFDDLYSGRPSKGIFYFVPYKSCFELIGSLMPIKNVE